MSEEVPTPRAFTPWERRVACYTDRRASEKKCNFLKKLEENWSGEKKNLSGNWFNVGNSSFLGS